MLVVTLSGSSLRDLSLKLLGMMQADSESCTPEGTEAEEDLHWPLLAA